MFIYSIFFFIPLLLFFSQKEAAKKNYTDYILLALVATILIGLRDQTGGDWSNYYKDFQNLGNKEYFSFFNGSSQNLSEISQYTLFWILHFLQPAYGYYIYHIMATALGFFALYLFAKEQPYFWLTITIAVPFFILIMIMGYTRQSMALSFIMLGLYYLKRHQTIQFMFFVLIATTFHASAIVMSLLALPYVFHKNFRYKNILFITLFVGFLFTVNSFQNYLDNKTQFYIKETMSSIGALPRLLITFLAAIFLFLYRNIWQHVFNDYLIWRTYGFAAVAAILALAILPSTSVDRIALYLLPLQLAVWPRIIYLSQPSDRQLIALGIIGGYTLTLYVWLNYANNVYMWLPFKHLFFS